MSSLELTPFRAPDAGSRDRMLPRAFSLGFHALFGLGVLALTLLDDGPLPGPVHEVRAFLAEPVALAAPPPPPPAPAAPRAAGTPRPPASDAALLTPIDVPMDVVPDDGLDLGSNTPGSDTGIPGGVDGGVPGGVVGGVVGGLPDAPAPPSARPLRVGRDVQAPRRLHGASPVYPQVARLSRLQGVVILDCVIDERGRVRDARVLKGIPLLEEAALDAVRKWVYAPSLLDGVPVAVQMTVTVAFQLANR